MNFRTTLKLEPLKQKIKHEDAILLLGSCFSEHIGNKIQEAKFDTLSNPFGVIFNPISLFNLLNSEMKDDFFDNNYLQNKGVWHNYHLHSKISNPNKEVLKKEVTQKYEATQKHLSKSKHIVLTFGTAFVYQLQNKNEVIANCHKMPSNLFEKRLLSVKEITTNFEKLHSQLTDNQQIILTVSPVRHLKESLSLNSVSKSILRIAAHELSQKYQNVHYFPSYELLLDDLRDYRFFKSDMIHPTAQAIEYIWKQFQDFAFDDETLLFIKDWNNILQALQHRPFYPASEEHQKFLHKTLQKVENFKNIDTSKEIELLRAAIIN